MNFEFEFFNIHVSHLTQLGMINIFILKYQNKNICKKLQFSPISNMFFGSFEHICTQT